jgi:hypothetical protein
MFPQSTIEEIIESERLMLLRAKDRYGRYYTHARGVSVFLSLCISAIDQDRMMFGRFHARITIANPEQEHFADVEDQGILDASQELTKKRYVWLHKNFEQKSQWIVQSPSKTSFPERGLGSVS